MSGTGCPLRSFPTPAISPTKVDPTVLEIAQEGGVGVLDYPFGGSCWVVTDSDAVAEMYLSDALSRRGMSAESAPRLTSNVLVEGGIGAADGPTHSRWRRVVNECLSQHRLKTVEAAACDQAAQLAATLAGTPNSDFFSGFSKPYSLLVLGALLGFGPEVHEVLTEAITGMLSAGRGEATHMALDQALGSVGAVAIDLIEQRRQDPQDDFTSDLLRASISLEAWEVITIVFSLIAAGFDSSTHMLTKIVSELLNDRELLATLVDDPSLVPNAVEELLRVIPLAGGVGLPFKVEERTKIAGQTFHPGDYVVPAIGVANLDEKRFAGGDRAQLASATTKHFSFGYAQRYCLGARVARLELIVAVRHLVEHYPDACIGEGRVEWSDATAVRRISHLPVDLGGYRG